MSMKKKQKKIKKHHSDASGLFALACAVVLLLSLISFVQKDPSANWLGIIGYSLAWITTYLFGLGGYLITLFLLFLGGKLLVRFDRSLLIFKTFSFFSLLV